MFGCRSPSTCTRSWAPRRSGHRSCSRKWCARGSWVRSPGRVSTRTSQRGDSPISKTSQPTPFGKYLLLQRIAVGGMAELFLAREQATQRRVVIKRILPYLSDEEDFVQMFLD